MLKFEPSVSNFSVLEARRVASSTAATMGSLFSFNGCIIGYICEETSLIVVKDGSRPSGLIAGNAAMGSLFSFYSSKKHTKFLVCFFVLKLNYWSEIFVLKLNYWSEIFEFKVVPQCVMVRCGVSNTIVLS